MNRVRILEAVEALRQRKCRPEREAIAHYIIRRHGTQFQDIFSDLETIVDQGDLIKVEYKGSTSYRSPEVFDTKASPLLTKHSKILNSNRTIRYILTAVSELLTENDTYSKDGIPFEEIKTKLLGYDPARFTTDSIPVFIQREVAVGTLIEGPKKRLLPKDLKTPNSFSGISNKVSATEPKMRGRKPAAAKSTSTPTPTTAKKTSPEIFAVKSAPVRIPTPPPPSNKPLRSYGRKGAGADKPPSPKEDSDDSNPPSLKEGEKDKSIGGQGSVASTPEETTTGRSMRNKRKREVFDPSDLPKKRPTATAPTAPPKLEKEKPPATKGKTAAVSTSTVQLRNAKSTPVPVPPKASTPGRKKKEDTSKGTPSTTLILCEHCQRHKNIKGQLENFLQCSDCSVSYHPSCLDYTKKQATLLIEKGTWQCSECKACQVCQGQCSKVTETILCSTCDMGFHYKCLKLNKKPSETSWLCPGCTGEEEGGEVEEKESKVEPAAEVIEDIKPDIKIKIENIEDDKLEPPKLIAMEESLPVEDTPKLVEVEIPAKLTRSAPKKRIITLYKKDEDASKGNGEKIEVSATTTETPVPPSEPEVIVIDDQIKEEPRKIDEDDDDDIPLDASKWTPAQVEAYFKKHGLREEGILFREQEIDGLALLLMRRQDIVNGMKLLLGPALKVFKLVVKLQQSGGKVEG